jgi:predicted nucleotidyltransferase
MAVISIRYPLCSIERQPEMRPVDITDITRAKEYHQRREAERRQRSEALRQRWLQTVRAAVTALAPRFPAIEGVYLFGSLTQTGRFRSDSDIDIAVLCSDLESESRFWQALETELSRSVDLRPLRGGVAEAVRLQGECIYERKDPSAAE